MGTQFGEDETCPVRMRVWCGAVLVTLLALGTAEAGAQVGTIAGTVIDVRNGLPIPDASIEVVGAIPVARSGTRGEFRQTNVPGSAAPLRAARIGYQAAAIDARVGDPSVRIEMTETSVKRDAVVVTGTAEEIQQRTLGKRGWHA